MNLNDLFTRTKNLESEERGSLRPVALSHFLDLIELNTHSIQPVFFGLDHHIPTSQCSDRHYQLRHARLHWLPPSSAAPLLKFVSLPEDLPTTSPPVTSLARR